MVSRWETRDRAMTPAELLDVAGALDVSVDVLLAAGVPRDRRRRSSRAGTADDRTRLGRRMSALRLQRGMDPVMVAGKVGISPYRLWRLEGGVDMTLFEFARLCLALDVSPSAVLGDLAKGPSSGAPRRRTQGRDGAVRRKLTTRANRRNSPGASLKTR
jgi:transcriptional regulator with XRE-family HTH domain